MKARSLFAVALLSLCALSAFAQPEYAPYVYAEPSTKELIDRVIHGLGGQAALRKIQTVRKVATIDESSPAGLLKIEFTGVAAFPDSFHARMNLAQGEIVTVATPRSAHMYMSTSPIKGAAMKLTEAEKAQLLKYFYEVPLMVLRNRIDPSCLFAKGDATKVNGREADTLFVRISGFEVQWFVDSETGRVIRTVTGDTVNDYSDFRDVNGIIAPHAVVTSRGGKQVGREKCHRYELNASVDTREMFATPTLWLSRAAFATQETEWKRKSGSRSYYYSDYSERWTPRKYLPPPDQRVTVSRYY